MRYTEEHDKFLRENINGKTYDELTKDFNSHFRLEVTVCALHQHVAKTLKLKAVDSFHHNFTKEQDIWLMKNIDLGTHEFVTKEFNEFFETDLKSSQIKDRCIKVLKIHKKENPTSFSKGQRNAYPIGTERIFNGYVYVKYNDTYFGGPMTMAQFKQNWMPKQRYIYEQTNGPIEEGYIIIFLDKDKTNFSIDNLYSVPRKIHSTMCKNNWYKDDKELTLAALKWCELRNVLNDFS